MGSWELCRWKPSSIRQELILEQAIQSRWPPPCAMEEADRVAEKFIKPTVLAGGEAKISRVGGELGRSVVFHFAGHAGLSHDGAAMLMADGPLGPNQAR